MVLLRETFLPCPAHKTLINSKQFLEQTNYTWECSARRPEVSSHQTHYILSRPEWEFTILSPVFSFSVSKRSFLATVFFPRQLGLVRQKRSFDEWRMGKFTHKARCTVTTMWFL